MFSRHTLETWNTWEPCVLALRPFWFAFPDVSLSDSRSPWYTGWEIDGGKNLSARQDQIRTLMRSSL